MKQLVGKAFKIFVYVGLVVAIFYMLDFLSLFDAEIYARTGSRGLTSFVPLSIAINLIVPFLIVTHMRLWKKFE